MRRHMCKISQHLHASSLLHNNAQIEKNTQPYHDYICMYVLTGVRTVCVYISNIGSMYVAASTACSDNHWTSMCMVSENSITYVHEA